MVDFYGYSLATIPSVVVITYGFIELLKNFIFKNSEKFKRYTPIVAAVFGMVLTVVVYFVAPDVVPTNSWIHAIILGFASGLSAVGINQITKQMKNGGDNSGS